MYKRQTLLREICGNGIDDDCNAMTADSGDRDMDSFDCAVDCDDSDPLVFPDSLGRCGMRFTYSEGFETCPAGWATSGASSSWACGAPTATFIPAAATGTNAWVTNLTGLYNTNELSYLTSPVFDMSMLRADPQLSFNHIYQTETSFDEGWLEMSRDGGTTWNKVGASGQGINWYSNATSQWWAGTSGAPGVWRPAAIRLTGAAGNASVRLRFVLSSDGSGNREGFGVDDIRLDNQLIDAAVSGLTLTGAACAATLDASVLVTNTGVVNLTGFDVSVTVDGGMPVVRNVPVALLAGASRTVTVPGLSIPAGVHTIVATVIAMGDEIATNNSRTVSAAGTIVVAATGYSEGFEMDAGGWSSAAESGPNSWARGMPTATFISRAGEGSFAWVTNPAGPYSDGENSFVTSPCLDLSAFAADPVLSFQHIFETESCCDEGWIDVWTAATGWQRLGNSGAGMSWYNAGSGGRYWNGTSGAVGAWRTASFPLAGTAGQIIRIRHGFSSDGSFTEDGFGIDAVQIRP